MQFNILVFPCGSEIALELYRSLRYSRHIRLFGANSTDDHGKFIYPDYIGDLPFFDHSDFIPAINTIIKERKIHAIYPAMDSAIAKLSEFSDQINCKIIGSENYTNQICLSKKLTYEILKKDVPCPKSYHLDEIKDGDFPLFMKPEVGYGSRGATLVNSRHEIAVQLEKYPNSLILEYLPGSELTIDCFTDRHGELKFFGPRLRNRVSNGISVNTCQYFEDLKEIKKIVQKINKRVKFRGAWFVQLKYNKNQQLALLEIAARFGGSSALYRNLGVNFGLLSVFDAFDFDVDIFANDFKIELDRALDNKYKMNIDFDVVYSDFDDCLIINDKVNIELLSFLYQCINEKKKIILITKHEFEIEKTLAAFRLSNIFDEIIHLNKEDKKFQFIKCKKAIFIDDSHKERKDVFCNLNIPVFAPDGVESLIK